MKQLGWFPLVIALCATVAVSQEDIVTNNSPSGKWSVTVTPPGTYLTEGGTLTFARSEPFTFGGVYSVLELNISLSSPSTNFFGGLFRVYADSGSNPAVDAATLPDTPLTTFTYRTDTDSLLAFPLTNLTVSPLKIKKITLRLLNSYTPLQVFIRKARLVKPSEVDTCSNSNACPAFSICTVASSDTQPACRCLPDYVYSASQNLCVADRPIFKHGFRTEWRVAPRTSVLTYYDLACGFTTVSGMYYDVTSKTKLDKQTQGQCASACCADPACQNYQWETLTQTCYLKTSAGTEKYWTDCVTGIRGTAGTMTVQLGPQESVEFVSAAEVPAVDVLSQPRVSFSMKLVTGSSATISFFVNGINQQRSYALSSTLTIADFPIILQPGVGTRVQRIAFKNTELTTRTFSIQEFTVVVPSACASNPCTAGSTCVDVRDSFRCQCPHDRSGTFCEERCPFGRTGSFCGYDINDCTNPNACENGGTCADGNGSYACVCASGYTGDRCQSIIDSCESAPCKHGGTCVNKRGFYLCSCYGQYLGANCETNIADIDEKKRAEKELELFKLRRSIKEASEPATDAFPNIGYLALGYDFLRGNPLHDGGGLDPGFRSRVLSLDYSLPAFTDDGAKSIPTGVVAVQSTSAALESLATVVDSESSYKEECSKSVSVSASYSGLGGSASMSASYSYKGSKERLAKSKSSFIDSSASTVTYSTRLANVTLDEHFKHDVMALPAESECDFSESPTDACQKYFDMFDKYGTHFSRAMKFGGRAMLRFSMTMSELDQAFSKSEEYSVKGSGSGMGFSMEVDAQLALQSSAKQHLKTTKTSTSIWFIGGTPSEGGFKEEEPLQPLSKWTSTVKDNPVPIQYELAPLTQLITAENFAGLLDPLEAKARRTSLNQALQYYCARVPGALCTDGEDISRAVTIHYGDYVTVSQPDAGTGPRKRWQTVERNNSIEADLQHVDEGVSGGSSPPLCFAHVWGDTLTATERHDARSHASVEWSRNLDDMVDFLTNMSWRETLAGVTLSNVVPAWGLLDIAAFADPAISTKDALERQSIHVMVGDNSLDYNQCRNTCNGLEDVPCTHFYWTKLPTAPMSGFPMRQLSAMRSAIGVPWPLPSTVFNTDPDYTAVSLCALVNMYSVQQSVMLVGPRAGGDVLMKYRISEPDAASGQCTNGLSGTNQQIVGALLTFSAVNRYQRRSREQAFRVVSPNFIRNVLRKPVMFGEEFKLYARGGFLEPDPVTPSRLFVQYNANPRRLFNVALHRQAEASTTAEVKDEATDASVAVDGNQDSCARTKPENTGSEKDPVWWMLELDEVIAVQTINIFHKKPKSEGADGLLNARVFMTEERQKPDWNSEGYVALGKQQTVYNLPVGGANARYVWIEQVGRPLDLCEVQVLAEDVADDATRFMAGNYKAGVNKLQYMRSGDDLLMQVTNSPQAQDNGIMVISPEPPTSPFISVQPLDAEFKRQVIRAKMAKKTARLTKTFSGNPSVSELAALRFVEVSATSEADECSASYLANTLIDCTYSVVTVSLTFSETVTRASLQTGNPFDLPGFEGRLQARNVRAVVQRLTEPAIVPLQVRLTPADNSGRVYQLKAYLARSARFEWGDKIVLSFTGVMGMGGQQLAKSFLVVPVKAYPMILEPTAPCVTFDSALFNCSRVLSSEQPQAVVQVRVRSARIDDARDVDVTSSVKNALQPDNVELVCSEQMPGVRVLKVLALAPVAPDPHYIYELLLSRRESAATVTCRVVFRNVFVETVGPTVELSSPEFATTI